MCGHEKLKQIPAWIGEIISSIDKVRFDRCHFKNFGDFSLNFENVYFMLVPDYNAFMDVQQEINHRILAKFTEEGVEFAYPTHVEYQKAG